MSRRHICLGAPTRQRGVAVITALLLTTLAITIVASLFWQQQVQVRSIENQRLQLQEQWILRGALDWARLILREDAKHSNVDHLGEPWAVTLAETRLDQYVDNGRADSEASDATLSGRIVDAQSRYNLKNLARDGSVIEREVAVLKRLLIAARLNPALARDVAEMMAATQKKPIDPAAAAGASNDAPQPISITHTDDLLAVPGFTAEMLDRLKDWVVVLPAVTPINANTAPAEVLAARLDTLSLSDAAALVASRERAYFRDAGDFKQRLPGTPLTPVAGEVEFASRYFIVNGKVRLNRATLEVQSLVERNGVNQPKVIWMREN